MDEISVIEVVAIFRSGKRIYCASSYWLAPEGLRHWLALHNALQSSLFLDAYIYLEGYVNWKLTLKSKPITIAGPLALKMRNHLNAVGGARKPAWEWELGGEQRFQPKEGNSNG